MSVSSYLIAKSVVPPVSFEEPWQLLSVRQAMALQSFAQSWADIALARLAEGREGSTPCMQLEGGRIISGDTGIIQLPEVTTFQDFKKYLFWLTV